MIIEVDQSSIGGVAAMFMSRNHADMALFGFDVAVATEFNTATDFNSVTSLGRSHNLAYSSHRPREEENGEMYTVNVGQNTLRCFLA